VLFQVCVPNRLDLAYEEACVEVQIRLVRIGT